MVRKMVATLVEIGRGRLTASDLLELFTLRDRSKSGAMMPPQGLCLESVEYPEATTSGSVIDARTIHDDRFENR